MAGRRFTRRRAGARRPAAPAVAALAIAAVAVLPGASAASRRPKLGAPRLTAALDRLPLDPLRYQFARGCARGAQPGAIALERLLTTSGVRGTSWGIYNCRLTRDGTRWSLHAEGRALDWHLDAWNPVDRAQARYLIQALLAPDPEGRPDALARRLGIQELIWNCWAWNAIVGPHRYAYCYRGRRLRPQLDPTLAHRDHIHIGMNWAGARLRTSYWTHRAPAP